MADGLRAQLEAIANQIPNQYSPTVLAERIDCRRAAFAGARLALTVARDEIDREQEPANVIVAQLLADFQETP